MNIDVINHDLMTIASSDTTKLNTDVILRTANICKLFRSQQCLIDTNSEATMAKEAERSKCLTYRDTK